MAAIQKIIDINNSELARNVSDSASWHADYSDTSYIYVGYLPPDLQEADIVAIFSQYGNPTHINLVKDRETGKSRGFCYLKYEDYRSCVLAIDNFNGIQVWNKRIKVDHVYYKLREGQQEDDYLVHYDEVKQIEIRDEKRLLEYEKEEDDEFLDPMAEYIGKKESSEENRKRSHRSHRHRRKERHERLERHREKHERHSDSKFRRQRSRSPSPHGASL